MTTDCYRNMFYAAFALLYFGDCIFPEKTVFYKTDEETHDYISEHRRKRGALYENCNSGSRQPGTGYGIYPI